MAAAEDGIRESTLQDSKSCLCVYLLYFFFFFFLIIPRPPRSTLFPYTTLFRSGAQVFGGLGSISDRVSFRFVPIVYENGVTFADAGWIRYNQAFGSDWLNIKVGSNELELPIYPGREYNMGASRFAVLYAYAVPGSVSRFSVLFPQPGIEIMGHDRGSRSRYSVNVFNSAGAPLAHC